MRRILTIFGLIILFAAPAKTAPADQSKALVDAMLDVDPRTRRTSGVGAAYGSIYSPTEQEANTDEELLPEDWSDVRLRSAGEYEGLRSPLFEDGLDAETPAREDLNSNVVPVIPLGHPEERAGVIYEDSPRP